MSFADVIEKVGRNETLSAQELQALRDEARAIDEIKNLVKSWVVPGSSMPSIRGLQAQNIFIPSGEIQMGTPAPGQSFSGVRIAQPPVEYGGEEWNIAGVEDDNLQVGIRASDGTLVAGGGDVWMDQFGLFFANEEGLLGFEDTGGSTDKLAIYSNGDNYLVIQNTFGEVGVGIDVDSATHAVLRFEFEEDESQAERAMLDIHPGTNGSRLGLGSKVFVDGEGGAGGGQTAITMSESTNTPANPTQDTQGRIYFRANKIIFQWNDGGTVRYKYLDLTGTGVTWTHTTSAP